MLGGTNFLFDNDADEEEGIDPQRIVEDEHNIVKEFCCAICQGVLWKPRSCASCQHLFCKKCIRIWLTINLNICPFRCSPYEEKRAPPYIHSLLGRLTIRCRNSAFGCGEILSYDQLERHQTIDCQFSTRQCHVCGNFVSKDEFDQHQPICEPTTIECFLCKCSIEPKSWQQHMTSCLKRKFNFIVDEILPANDPFLFQQEDNANNRFMQLNIRLQQFLSAMPKIDLIGYDRFIRSRQQNICLRIWSTFQLILHNKWQTAQIIMLLLCFGIGCMAGISFSLFLYTMKQLEILPYRSSAIIILVSGLLSFTIPSLLASVGNTSLIICIALVLMLSSLMFSDLPVEYFRIHISSIQLLILYIILFLLVELTLFFIRFYFDYLPPYISAGCSAWLVIFCTFQMRAYY
ncbi:unnamed protein product [Adineta ricciae]|uniref:RING-type domain-containing protein n=1 Tax=Adineta ricciae TaxID=249248 RepID=A0A814PCR0_ADIRI|nr:unnamed protein product [Adineta ricciae]